MPRPKSSKVYSFFKPNLATGKNVCQINQCFTEISSHAKNCERHIEHMHYNVYKQHFLNQNTELSDGTDTLKNKRPFEIQDSYGNYNKKIATFQQFFLEEASTKNTINIQITAKDLVEACTDIVTINGRCFEMLEDSGFKKIINPIIKGLGNTVAINTKTIRGEVIERAKSVINDIKNLVNNRLVCLKMDCVKGKNRSILVINIYITLHNSSVTTIKTLSMIEMCEQHTTFYLQQKVYGVLAEYGISKHQVYSITTDNASNFVKMTDLLDKDNESNSEDDNEETDGDTLTSNILELGNSIAEINSLTTLLTCAAHSLQLCVHDAFKDTAINAMITISRVVVKKLKTSAVAHLVKSLNPNLLKAVIDVPTRWESTFNMLNRLLKLKYACVELSNTYEELKLSPSVWEILESTVISLNPIRTATLKLQKENITIGDFHGIWIECYGDTKNTNSIISNKLCEAMEIREKFLFSNPVFIAGIFLDPRFQILLDDDCKRIAKEHLINLWRVIYLLEISESDFNVKSNIKDEEQDNLQQPVQNLENYIKAMTANIEILQKSNDNDSSIIPIKIILESFDGVARIHSSSDVREYWDNMKLIKPQLFKLASVLLSVPVNQISMERAFSSLKYTASDICTSLTPNMHESIMLIKNNYVLGKD